MLPARQLALCCSGCGGPPAVAGLCRRCYARAVHSRRRFAGHRDQVLARDGYTCQGCGAGNQKIVHHRRPGQHAARWLVTLCPACHAVVHHRRRQRRWLATPLLKLWQEQHPTMPLQLPLPLEGRE